MRKVDDIEHKCPHHFWQNMRTFKCAWTTKAALDFVENKIGQNVSCLFICLPLGHCYSVHWRPRPQRPGGRQGRPRQPSWLVVVWYMRLIFGCHKCLPTNGMSTERGGNHISPPSDWLARLNWTRLVRLTESKEKISEGEHGMDGREEWK